MNVGDYMISAPKKLSRLETKIEKRKAAIAKLMRCENTATNLLLRICGVPDL